MIPGHETVKIGENVRLGKPTQHPQAFGIVRGVKIETTHIQYEVEITHFDKKPAAVGETIYVTHHILRKNDNDPTALLKAIL